MFAAAGDKAIVQRVVVMIVTISMNDECSGMNREWRRMNDVWCMKHNDRADVDDGDVDTDADADADDDDDDDDGDGDGDGDGDDTKIMMMTFKEKLEISPAKVDVGYPEDHVKHVE